MTGFRKGDLAPAFHTLRLVATGKKNPEASNRRMNFNAAVVDCLPKGFTPIGCFYGVEKSKVSSEVREWFDKLEGE